MIDPPPCPCGLKRELRWIERGLGVMSLTAVCPECYPIKYKAWRESLKNG